MSAIAESLRELADVLDRDGAPEVRFAGLNLHLADPSRADEFTEQLGLTEGESMDGGSVRWLDGRLGSLELAIFRPGAFEETP